MDWTEDRPLTHPAAASAVAKLVKGLSDAVYVLKPRHLVFVCGAAFDPLKTNLRNDFLTWAKANVSDQVSLLLSEDTYKLAQVHGHKFINLSEFEQIIAGASDCVVVFPESAGSYAELGIFATSETIRRKTLIGNDQKHCIQDSFLLLGPIHAIDHESIFSPSVMFDSQFGVDAKFPERVWERIKGRMKVIPRRTRLDASHFVDLKLQQQMALIAGIIRITGLAKFGDLLYLIRQLYPERHNDAHILKMTLNTLVALSQIGEPAREVYFPFTKSDFNLEVKGDQNRLSSKFRLFWIKEFPRLWNYRK